MNTLKVAGAALNQTPFDWESNKKNIEDAIRASNEVGVKVLCLPELCVTGYGCGDMFLSPDFCRSAWRLARDIMQRMDVAPDMIYTLGLPLHLPMGVFNGALVVSNKQPVGFVPKQNLARDGIHYEPRHFRPWLPGEMTTVHHEQVGPITVGDVMIGHNGWNIGFEICEDAWVANRPGIRLARSGCDLILNPSASHFSKGKHETRKRFVVDASRAFGAGYVYANLLGNEAGRAIYDGGTIVASCGRTVALGSRLLFNRVVVTTGVLDLDEIRASRANGSIGYDLKGAIRTLRTPIWLESEARLDMDEATELTFSGDEFKVSDVSAASRPPCGAHDDTVFHEFERAVALGLFDYLRKSRAKKFVVSLSGGADSTATSVLAHMVPVFGVMDLGMEQFCRSVGLEFSFAEMLVTDTYESWATRRLLHCVYQRTRNSSDTTESTAMAVADAIGAEFESVDIDGICEGYYKLLGGLSWDNPNQDIPMQNVQARVRGVMAWGVTNLSNALLLACNNKSESAVGYTTMHGDTCGGICPVGGVLKTFILAYLKYVAERSQYANGALAEAVASLCKRPPTAELQPKDRNQTDEGDVGPYDLRDDLQHWVVVQRRSPQTCLDMALAKYGKYGQDDILAWVRRFFTLLARNQWKREQLAPAFHVDDNNMDPKSWWRFPILNGGWGAELKALKIKSDAR